MMVGQDQRPIDPDRKIPHGHHLEARPAGEVWGIDRSGMYDCRFTMGRQNRCQAIATITIDRGRTRSGNPLLWRYCEAHSYGRWVENDLVMHWVLVADVPTS